MTVKVERCMVTCPFCLERINGWAMFVLRYEYVKYRIYPSRYEPKGKTPEIEAQANAFERKQLKHHLTSCSHAAILSHAVREHYKLDTL